IYMHDGYANGGDGSAHRLNRDVQHLRIVLKAEIAQEPAACGSAVRAAACEPREWSARPNHGLDQSSRGDALAEVQAIAQDSIHAKMNRQRTHDVVQPLADQNHFAPVRQHLLQVLDAALLQARLQDIFEIFLAQKIETIATHAAKHSMKQARSNDAIRRVE